MSPSEIFSLANLTVMPMWVLMVFLPKWKVTRFLIDFKVIPIVLSVIYVIYILVAMLNHGFMDFGSLSSVMELFREEDALLAGWVHYLAFDLLVGMWILDRNRESGIHQLLIVPCLLLTFMFGPTGFLLFMAIKMVKQRNTQN